jgi:predicted NBD/HSP70 family sugar kinase
MLAPEEGMTKTDADNGAARAESLSRLGGGANQVGARAYNERLTLSLIRRNGPLSKAALARLTGLSAQTLSQIVRHLEADGLVLPQERVRGRIGQPSVPYALNPMGALSFGVKIGRRSTDLVLCDFLGAILNRAKLTYAYPCPRETLSFVRQQVAAMRRRYKRGERFIGVGIAMPFQIWEWESEVAAPPGALDDWRDLDVAAEVARHTRLPAMLANDATAACGAELAHLDRGLHSDFLYFFIGSFIGGGVVLNGALYSGRSANAGAVGSMPVYVGGRISQLIQHASLMVLEKALLKAGQDASLLQDPQADWTSVGPPLKHWIGGVSESLAAAIVASMSVIDFPIVRIDGAMPRNVLSEIIAGTRARIGRLDRQGLTPFEITAGTIGTDARALGGAMLPILANFTCDPEVLLKDVSPTTAHPDLMHGAS